MQEPSGALRARSGASWRRPTPAATARAPLLQRSAAVPRPPLLLRYHGQPQLGGVVFGGAMPPVRPRMASRSTTPPWRCGWEGRGVTCSSACRAPRTRAARLACRASTLPTPQGACPRAAARRAAAAAAGSPGPARCAAAPTLGKPCAPPRAQLPWNPPPPRNTHNYAPRSA
jgi:hypothetical protein